MMLWDLSQLWTSSVDLACPDIMLTLSELWAVTQEPIPFSVSTNAQTQIGDLSRVDITT
jgi:hypothetical protein